MNSGIFIVEDESIVSMELQYRIRQLGYDIAGTANSGEEALEKIFSSSPSLVLMDIRLRGKLSGFETAGKIREKFVVPIVFITAFSDEDTKARISQIYNSHILSKPFDHHMFVKTISTLLDKKSASINSY